MQLRSALLAATVLATPIAASAQPVTGLYVGAGAGVNIMPNIQVNPNTIFGVGTANLKSAVGFAGVVSAGWGFGNGLRAELEGDYRNNPFNDGSGFLGGSVSGHGREQKFGPMVNVLYDFNGLTPWFVPYLGVGAGYQWANENGVALTSFTGPSSLVLKNQSEGSFAYQAIVGAAIPMPAIPGLAITAEYRYMGLAGSRNYNAVSTVGTVSRFGSVSLKNDHNNSVLLGIRYNFGVAPPPPPAPAPVPAAAPARSYLVFFDWDKYNLTDRARQIISEAAANSTKVQYTRIEVNGYTDTSGTPKYNLGLSIRRANAVKAELIKDGVPANSITTQGFGDTHLLVPTGPGVREPQNRRVEIIIR
jgi:OmpA-OmpF porin, OOP family